jgi:hypothetical protein
MFALRLDDGMAEMRPPVGTAACIAPSPTGPDVVVALRTAWDTKEDATVFASALEQWAAAGGSHPTITQDGERVTAVFATANGAGTPQPPHSGRETALGSLGRAAGGGPRGRGGRTPLTVHGSRASGRADLGRHAGDDPSTT